MKCILILEDEPLIALDLTLACEDAGLGSVTAASCRQAMEALANHPCDGAVLDVNLGRGETCEVIAHELKQRGIPFLLHTGDLNRVGEFLREIDAPIIPKPANADEVIARLVKLAA